MPKKQTLEQLLKMAKEIHGDKYDYSLITEYHGLKYKYPIICPEHGIFYKSLTKHVYAKQGCPVCAKRFRYNTKTFICTAQKLPHCKNYSFEKTEYVNNKTKIIVTCKEHGDFLIAPGHLLSGEGCPTCRYIKSSAGIRRSIDEIKEIATSVHKSKYDYSLITDYKNDRVKYPIICPEHGVFYQTMNNHIKGKQGCPICGRERCGLSRRITFEEWSEMAKSVHNNFYTYHKEDYIDNSSKTRITCPKHGDFWQCASNHTWLKQGCPKCGHTISSAEDEIATYIKSLGFEIETRKRITGRTEVDIYVPSQHFAIEYDGLYWHSELMKTRGFHLKKTKTVESLGVRLFHIFEDEWLEKPEIVKSMIKNQLGITGNRIFARKCQLKEIDTPTARKFLTENHLQGYCPSGVRIGLFYNDELVAVMTFGKSRHFIGSGKYEIELLRYATKIDTLVVGGASKMFKYYVRTHNPQSIVSYADRRWSNGHLYTTLGFEKYNESKPNYYYIRGPKRIYRFNMRKSILVKKFGCPPDMTEREFCYKNKYYRIYDCGCLCYCWKKQKN